MGRTRTTTFAASLLVAALAAGLSAQPAAAAPKPKIQFNGFGTFGTDDAGLTLAGTGTGVPFDGGFSGVMAADDHSLPAPGECEPAHASLQLDGAHGRFVVLEGAGRVCGEWTSATWRVTHRYAGRYAVTDASTGRYRGDDGFYEIAITDAGAVSVFVIDT